MKYRADDHHRTRGECSAGRLRLKVRFRLAAAELRLIQAPQSPGSRNDTFGGSAMPMRGEPRSRPVSILKDVKRKCQLPGIRGL